MTNQLGLLYLSLTDLVEPLRHRLDSLEAVEQLAYRYGWRAGLDEPAFESIRQAWSVREPLEAFVAVAEDLRDRLDADPEAEIGATEIARLAQAAAPLVAALADFGLETSTGLTAPYDREEFWESLADHLLDDLLEEYLRIHRPGFYLVLRLWGVIRYEATHPSGAFRRPYTRVVVDWDQAVAMVRDPLGALRRAYHWDDPDRPFEHQAALQSLGHALRAAGLPTTVLAPAIEVEETLSPGPGHHVQDDAGALRTVFLQGASEMDQTFYRLGLEVLPAARTGEADPSGLLVRLILEGIAGARLPLGEHLVLEWSVAAGVGDALGFAVFPGEAVFVGGEPVVGTRVEMSSTEDGAWQLLGNAQTSRIELAGVSAALTLGGRASDPEIELRLAAPGAGGQPGCKVVVSLADADAFIESLVPERTFEVAFSPEIVWSSRRGLTFNGTSTPRIELPLNVGLGAVTLTNVSIAVAGKEGNGSSGVVSCRVGAGLRGRLGPVQFVVDQLGFACDVVRHVREELSALLPADAPVLGGLGVDLGFAPPIGIGLAIDTSVVSGSGYLFHDPATGQYVGAVQLDLEFLTLQAVGLITTRMPDGSRGFSLLVIVSAEDFTPTNLPFGFRLTGVGGLFGLNRAADVDALRAGLKNRSLDGVLFPENPVADIARIVTALQTVMPVREGRFLGGILGQFEWGVPTVATIELGLVIELPPPVRLVILGQIRVLLPHADHVLVRLQMDVLGVIDWDRDELSVDAVLYDSFILGHAITGEMALRSRWSGEPTFLLAVGGFNPNFAPPAGFPKLRRVALTLNRGDSTRLRLESYFAVTSNTVQAGARIDVLVRASGFSVEGYLGFDALFQFSPFMFTVDIRGGVTLKWHGRTLLGVELELTLSGPSPWHARGRATFKIWRFSKSISFDRVCGADNPPPALAPADPLPALIEALSDPRNWSAELTERRGTVLTLRERRDAGELMVHPLGELTVRQRVVPLEIRIDRFGNTVPSGERRFTVALTDDGGPRPPVQPVLDLFAPAQFIEMTDAAKLRRPSFEPMEAGIRIGRGLEFAGDGDPGLIGEAAIEYETVVPGATPEEDTRDVAPFEVGARELLEAVAVHHFRPPARRTGAARFAAPRLGVDVPEARYVVASTSDLSPVPLPDLDVEGAPSYTAAAQALWRHEEARPEDRGSLQVITVFRPQKGPG